MTYVLLAPALTAQMLDGFEGVIFADGYGAYEALAREGPAITLSHCWAHNPERSVIPRLGMIPAEEGGIRHIYSR